ncbi:hypothetical protein SETIT_8G172900v2, partial [Setaria italica]
MDAGDGEDRISGLPDELLHAIHICLGSPRAAVRTGVLSRRWRHVWTPLPELNLAEGVNAPLPLASFLDTVNAALAACAPRTLKDSASSRPPRRRLWPRLPGTARRAVAVLRFGARDDGEEAVLELPACEGVTKICLRLHGAWRVRLPSAGLLRALTDLTIICDCMDGSELTALVCTQCPCLMDLRLRIRLDNASDISIWSDSLRSLFFSVWKTRRLEIARISAPKFAEVVWSNDTYDARHHQFDDLGRRLWLLELDQNVSLMQQFDEVDELKLGIFIPEGIAGYRSLLNETNKLSKCKILSISLPWRHHGMRCPCPPSCLCLLEESHMIDDIALNSLEEVEITSNTSYHEVLEFVEQLSRCNAEILKKIVLKHRMNSAPPPTKE